MNKLFPFEQIPTPSPRYRGMTVSSCYIPMRDGVRLAADVWLPGNLPRGVKIPAILFQTRYWRSMELRVPFKWFLSSVEQLDPILRQMKPLFTGRGYALVYVDVRGTGASYGVWRFPWEPITLQDSVDILDWIVAQPWSNGMVGGMGVSYLGTTAELLLATGHPALKAVVPMFNHPDPYTDASYPGGLFNERFIHAWSEMDAALDRNNLPLAYGKLFSLVLRGVKPVNGEVGKIALEEAIGMHRENGQAYEYASVLNFRDELHPQGGYCADDLCVIRHWEVIRSSQVPVFGWASWMDAGTAQAALRRFLTFPGVQRAAIGAWSHGGLMQASPYRPPQAAPDPGPVGQWRVILAFFDAFLQPPAEGLNPESEIYFYTLGAETWQKSTSWPPADVRREQWYFGPQRSLALTHPEEDGLDVYTVDFSATSGAQNRWWELGALERKTVVIPDLASQPASLLSYTSPPLEKDIEISGSPVVTLWVDSSEPDCGFYVYLEEVAPGGIATYITEGQLRAIHHPASQEAPPYHIQIPYHTFRQADALPLVPGEVAPICFGLLPVSARVRSGHCLRVSIAGHDHGTFRRVPATGTPVWKIYRSQARPSGIVLPIRGRPV